MALPIMETETAKRKGLSMNPSISRTIPSDHPAKDALSDGLITADEYDAVMENLEAVNASVTSWGGLYTQLATGEVIVQDLSPRDDGRNEALEALFRGLSAISLQGGGEGRLKALAKSVERFADLSPMSRPTREAGEIADISFVKAQWGNGWTIEARIDDQKKRWHFGENRLELPTPEELRQDRDFMAVVKKLRAHPEAWSYAQSEKSTEYDSLMEVLKKIGF